MPAATAAVRISYPSTRGPELPAEPHGVFMTRSTSPARISLHYVARSVAELADYLGVHAVTAQHVRGPVGRQDPEAEVGRAA